MEDLWFSFLNNNLLANTVFIIVFVVASALVAMGLLYAVNRFFKVRSTFLKLLGAVLAPSITSILIDLFGAHVLYPISWILLILCVAVGYAAWYLVAYFVYRKLFSTPLRTTVRVLATYLLTSWVLFFVVTLGFNLVFNSNSTFCAAALRMGPATAGHDCETYSIPLTDNLLYSVVETAVPVPGFLAFLIESLLL